MAQEPNTSRRDLGRRVRAGGVNWARETASGVVTSLATVLFCLVLVQLGLAREGQKFSLELFKPQEFWKSFSGLVVEWSQWNEWLLLALSALFALLTLGVYLLRRRALRRESPSEAERRPWLGRLEGATRGMRVVFFLGMWSAILLGAYGYQQYLWRVKLPVPEGRIGVAFSRQVGGSVAQDQLADYLRQMGHEDQIVLRDLPVTFDARDTAEAQRLARRINADAVIIYRAESDAPAEAPGGPGANRPPLRPVRADGRHVAYIVFADPSFGIEIPVLQPNGGGGQSVSFRQKDGVETPRLEATDLGRLMEAAAGILLYDKDRYLPAIAHLENALDGSGGTPASDALVQFYLGSARFVLGEEEPAGRAFDQVIGLHEGRGRLGVQDRLLLARAYIRRGEIAFGAGDLEGSEALVRKAVALRAPLEQDAGALADPATFRQLHDVFGQAYIKMMDIAGRRDDDAARRLWAGRASESARALVERTGDDRAREDGIWLTYRSGDCEAAYRLGYERIGRRPEDKSTRQLLLRLAMIRDGVFNSLEARTQREAILALDERNLPELRLLLLEQGYAALTDDPAYLADERETLDRILAADPSNVRAIAKYAEDAATTLVTGNLGFGLAAQGEPRTAEKLAAEGQRDPAAVRRALAQIETARPYVLRWSEELEPGTAAPALANAMLSGKANIILSRYTLFGSVTSGDAELTKAYEPAWQRAVDDLNRVLDPARKPNRREQMLAHRDLAPLWSERFISLGIREQPGGEAALRQALVHAQAATAILETDAAVLAADRAAAAVAYNNLATIAGFAATAAQESGDRGRAAELLTLQRTAVRRSTALREEWQAEIAAKQGADARLLTCGDASPLRQASEANAAGDPQRALELARRYVETYPGDPAGLLDLGWYQYRTGDLAAALATTARFERAVPAHPYGPGNRAVILLAQGKPAEAKQAIGRMTEVLAAEHPGVGLPHLTSAAGDLLALARDEARTREGVRGLLPALEAHVASLPPEARGRHGSHLIYALNNLGGAALWSEDYAAARRLYESGLTINPDYALLRANLALAHLAAGDAATAEREYERAIFAAAGYVTAAGGEDSTAADRRAAAADARAELEAAGTALDLMLMQKPDLAARGARSAELLRRAVAGLGS